jgi:mannose-1-phosphate guanylyltransferase/mannose-6-phosphate isomerase
MFLFKASSLLDELTQYDPVMLDACKAAWQASKVDLDFTRLDKDAFAKCPSQSIDYAVMERTDKAAVIPADIGWSDIGTWAAVRDLSEQDAHGNALTGEAFVLDGKNNLVRSEGLLTTVVGLDNVIVVATQVAVLVAHSSASARVKDLVEELKKQKRPEAQEHKRVYRPWGYYQSVDNGARYQVKRIVVKPDGRLSLQKHHHRAEHWIVVSGTAEVTVDGKVQQVHENESIYLPIGCVHRLVNPGKINLELIEVQTGSYLGEDDIIRMEDIYNRS